MEGKILTSTIIMKLVYTHHNSMLVGLVRGKLELEGIEVVLRNELAAGGAGELAPTDAWPEVWIADDRDYARAKALVDALDDTRSRGQWHCTLCGEDNDESFDLCWKCQAQNPAQLSNSAG